MNVRSIALLAFVTGALTACGSDNTAPLATCRVTLSGAQTGTFDCTAVGAWISSSDSAAVVISNQTTTPAILLGVGRRGLWSTGTFTNTDAGALGSSTIQNGQAYWVAASAASNGVAGGVGSYTLNLTTAAGTAVSGGEVYIVHGTFNATALAVPGTTASGTVTIQVTF